ncbi:MAG: putative permease often clustered with de novo purine synthesis [Herminiimonas sp.]|nr:putative permease often clustered with de novo purine synthesis [Herminiimonas sp.]
MALNLTPERKQAWLWLVLGILLVVLLVVLGPVLTPFIAAGILAYALNPGVDWLSRRRVGRFTLPRPVAVLLMMLVLFALLLALVLIVAPILNNEIPLLREKIPASLARLNEILAPRLHDMGIETRMDVEGIKSFLTERFASADKDVWRSVLTSVGIGGLAVLGWLATFLLVPVVLFYLLVDWHALLARLGNAVPRRWLFQTVALARDVDRLLAQYLRGQLLVMLILAVYYSVALVLAGFDVALPVGIITGLLIFIPYLGYGIGLVLALIAATLQFDGLQGLILVAAIYGFGQVIESFYLTPRLVGERIGLHPLAVIFALLAFGQLFGFVGVLLALPASAIVSVAAGRMRQHYLQSGFYLQS